MSFWASDSFIYYEFFWCLENLVKITKIIAYTLLSEIGIKTLTPDQQTEYELGLDYFNEASYQPGASHKVDYYKKAWEQGKKVLELVWTDSGLAYGSRLP